MHLLAKCGLLHPRCRLPRIWPHISHSLCSASIFMHLPTTSDAACPSCTPVSQQRPPEASPKAACGQKISVPALAGVWHVCVMPASGGFDNEEITRCDTRDTHSSTSGFCGSARGGCKTISHEPFSTPHSSTGTTFLAQGAALSCVSRVCSAVAQLTPVGQVHSCIHDNVCVCVCVFVCVCP